VGRSRWGGRARGHGFWRCQRERTGRTRRSADARARGATNLPDGPMHGRGGEERRDGRAPLDIDRGVVKKCADVDTRTEAVSIRLCNIGNILTMYTTYNWKIEIIARENQYGLSLGFHCNTFLGSKVLSNHNRNMFFP
jgi:hypothetical protein